MTMAATEIGAAGALRPVVAIPARNEEAALPRQIAALGRQSVIATLAAPLEVKLVLNNTTDRSRQVAEEAAAARSMAWRRTGSS